MPVLIFYEKISTVWKKPSLHERGSLVCFFELINRKVFYKPQWMSSEIFCRLKTRQTFEIMEIFLLDFEQTFLD
jgi:hypothetical protein